MGDAIAATRLVSQVQAASDDQHQVAEYKVALFMIIEGVGAFLIREQFQELGQRRVRISSCGT